MVFLKNFSTAATILGLLFSSSTLSFVSGHGLVEDPPARNQYCGVVTKPEHVYNPPLIHPECGALFPDTKVHEFMSVLTHDVGRKCVTPLPPYVCGFGSETWQGGMTPWDKTGVDWPVSSMSAGPNNITWNIGWGPHFDDTQEFVYYITTDTFAYDGNAPLTWADFEATPFCDLQFDWSNMFANPNIVPLTNINKFRTTCNVPVPTGRHVIYAEWGRNPNTYERFHGCIDVSFGPVTPPPTASPVEVTPAPVDSPTDPPVDPTPAPIAPVIVAPITSAPIITLAPVLIQRVVHALSRFKKAAMLGLQAS